MEIMERELQKKAIQYLRSLGAFVWKINDRFMAGLPDCLVVLWGKTFFIEFKRPGARLTRLQEFVKDRIEGAGGFVFIIRSMDQLKDLVRGIKNWNLEVQRLKNEKQCLKKEGSDGKRGL